ncbi:diguanylate cyclase [Pseudomonas sp. DC3000-4b1]|uniref:sensor domain-containing diguanylate cyclase n=1 Tax=unclassified Pseudomonas TaxID=196821 RepID=UPI003CEF0505
MNRSLDLTELHWLLAITQSIDVGVVVFDRQFNVTVWNTFIENHSGVPAREAQGKSFFSLFHEVDQTWFTRKVESVITLGSPSFTIWEQRPHLLKFETYQPITGSEPFMYQNTTLFPLRSINNQVEHICLVIYDVTEVATNRRQLQMVNAQLQKLSSTDRLTGLYNRGHWEEALKHEYARHSRYGNDCTLIMFDIDHFKQVNDTYGHPGGDRVIQRVADMVREHVRDSDICGRYGGEEFALLLPDTDKEGGQILAERLRASIEETVVEHDGKLIRFTISLGVADLQRPAADHQELIERADQALYTSKRSGRNRVTVHA